MTEKLPAASMDDEQTQLVLNYHELMKSYVDERIRDPYNEDETTTNYLQEVIQLLSASISKAADPEPLMDAVLLVKCFAATVLMSSKRSVQIPMFLDWVHSVQNDVAKWTEKLKEELIAEKTIRNEFWKLLIHYTITGKFSDAAELLQNSELADDVEIGYIYELLDSYPVEANKYSVFMHWRQNALAWYTNVQQQPNGPHKFQREIETIANILIGDTNTITQRASDWVSAVSGLFLYRDPSQDSLESHFSAAVAVHEVNVIPTWEEGCKALFEDKTVAALGSLQLLDISSSVVISEFCNERGLFQKYSTASGKVGGGVREELALAYIATCLAEPALVEIGTEVMVNVGSSQAKQAARILLPQLIQRAPDNANLAIDTAEQLDLPELETELCKIAAEADLNDSRYVSAISFFYRAADYQRVKDTAWALFREILITKQPVADEYTLSVLRETHNINSIDLSMTIKDNLAPAAVLLALLDAIESENVDEILISLNGLMTFPDPPLEYYPLLVALVSGVSGSVLTMKNMAMLMSALDLWETASDSTKSLSYDLISEASNYPAWQPILGTDQEPSKLVWLLKRQLAKEVCL